MAGAWVDGVRQGRGSSQAAGPPLPRAGAAQRGLQQPPRAHTGTSWTVPRKKPPSRAVRCSHLPTPGHERAKPHAELLGYLLFIAFGSGTNQGAAGQHSQRSQRPQSAPARHTAPSLVSGMRKDKLPNCKTCVTASSKSLSPPPDEHRAEMKITSACLTTSGRVKPLFQHLPPSCGHAGPESLTLRCPRAAKQPNFTTTSHPDGDATPAVSLHRALLGLFLNSSRQRLTNTQRCKCHAKNVSEKTPSSVNPNCKRI